MKINIPAQPPQNGVDYGGRLDFDPIKQKRLQEHSDRALETILATAQEQLSHPKQSEGVGCESCEFTGRTQLTPAPIEKVDLNIVLDNVIKHLDDLYYNPLTIDQGVAVEGAVKYLARQYDFVKNED